jgi:hypothetical protein
MTEGPLERLRAEAARDDYPSMARLAQALYETGLSPREVLRECYGVEFPDEFFVLREADPELPFYFTNQPANLAIPLDRGGPPLTDDPMSNRERAVRARDPDLVPLVLCLNNYVRFGGMLLCYRLSELAAGRTTVFGIEYYATPDSQITRCADSLLAALHEHLAANAYWTEQERRRTAGHSGGSTVDDEEVEMAHEMVGEIEELRRQVSSGHGD